jgi:hypothetical protein
MRTRPTPDPGCHWITCRFTSAASVANDGADDDGVDDDGVDGDGAGGGEVWGVDLGRVCSIEEA